jgi:enoyl-[acyl-carrier-protein] reductase (NADH)
MEQNVRKLSATLDSPLVLPCDVQSDADLDATFERADRRFGKKGVVDLTGINGYYAFLAMQLNVARYPIPTDGRSLTRLPR